MNQSKRAFTRTLNWLSRNRLSLGIVNSIFIYTKQGVSNFLVYWRRKKTANLVSGFTLIELLVVIAIIGILSSVVLANMNGSRQKARDVKRIADVKQLQLSLELYFDNNAKYPGVLATLEPDYISNVPTPPAGISGVDEYKYVPLGGSACNSFHLGSALEQSSNKALIDDSDATVSGSVGSNCGSAVTATEDFYGASMTCSDTAGTDQCFDVTP